MLFDSSGKLALIRNAYGRSDSLVRPGGGLRLFEKRRSRGTGVPREAEVAAAMTVLLQGR